MQMSSQAPNYIQTRIPGSMALNTISNSYTFLWRLLTKFSQIRASGIKKLGKYWWAVLTISTYKYYASEMTFQAFILPSLQKLPYFIDVL